MIGQELQLITKLNIKIKMRNKYLNYIGFCFLFFLIIACVNKSNNDQKIYYDRYLFKKTLNTSELAVSVVAKNLDVPWDLSWGDNDSILWFSEIKGHVNKLNIRTGKVKTVLALNDILVDKSYGLLGFAVHPDLKNQPYVFLHYTYLINDKIFSKLVRYTSRGDELVFPRILLNGIPGNTYHNGSRIVISSDNKIFLTIGDAGDKKYAQNVDVLSGKVLRLNIDGTIPDDNPIRGNMVWSWGHRNAQGLVIANNKLYSSEHGEANDDEINIIQAGKNYGWPDVTGACNQPYEMRYCNDSLIVEPILAWTPTIAPAGIAYYGSKEIPEWSNSLLVTSLKDASLRVLRLSSDGLTVEKEIIAFNRQFGRLRDVVTAPNGDIYLCTSNKDWHPKSNPEFYTDLKLPFDDDDKIIRIHKASKDLSNQLSEMKEKESSIDKDLITNDYENVQDSGMKLYMNYCASCHKADGSGSENMFPPITKSESVSDKKRLIETVVNGLSGPIQVQGKLYNQEMPSFRFLTDKELSDVLTYVRASFGNSRPPISESEIAKYKSSIKN